MARVVNICVLLIFHHLQAQPATLASLVGALNLRTPTHPAAQASLRALGEEECTSISTPPQVEYARPSWTQSLIQSTEASSSGYDDQAPIAAPATVRYSCCHSMSTALTLVESLRPPKLGDEFVRACNSFVASMAIASVGSVSSWQLLYEHTKLAENLVIPASDFGPFSLSASASATCCRCCLM